MKLRVSEIVTLHGVMEAPDQWVFSYTDKEFLLELEAKVIHYQVTTKL